MSSIAWGDVATWVSGVATVVAVVFAGVEIRSSRHDQAKEATLQLKSVAVTWRARNVPTDSHADGQGRLTSTYVITIHNPSRTAVTNAAVTLTFLCDVERVHYDGTAEPASRTMVLDTPVVAGQSAHPWKREIRIRAEDRGMLRYTKAALHFVTVDNVPYDSEWGRDLPAGTGPSE